MSTHLHTTNLPNGWTAHGYADYGDVRYKVRDERGYIRDDVDSLETAYRLAARIDANRVALTPRCRIEWTR